MMMKGIQHFQHVLIPFFNFSVTIAEMSAAANRYHQQGSYRWFLTKVVPFLAEKNPRFAYYFVLVHRGREDFVDAQQPIGTFVGQLEDLAQDLKEPLETLFTEAHIFIKSQYAHRVLINNLLTAGFTDITAESMLSHRNARTRRAILNRRNQLVGTSACFDPYEGEEGPIKAGSTVFHIVDAKFRRLQSICLDAEAFDQYFGVAAEQPRFSEESLQDLENEIDAMDSEEEKSEARESLAAMRSAKIVCNPRIVYQCVEAAEKLTAYRRLPFGITVYVEEEEVIAKVKKGDHHVLFPTKKVLGPIVSDCVRLGADFVGADHCQTDYPDKIHGIRRLPSRSANAPNLSEALRGLFLSEGGSRTTRRSGRLRHRRHQRRQTRRRC
jgi:hypothetical protein